MHKLWDDKSQCGDIQKKKKNHTITATIEATQLSEKTQKSFSYACHICGLNGHEMIDCPKFAKMEKMSHGKFMTITEVQHIIETNSHCECEFGGC